jgi:hypothetical protein
MKTIFSRLAATPSLKQVFAVIEVVNNTLSLYARLPVTIATKINAAFKSAVKFVLLRSDIAKIAPAIIRSLSVDMVDLYGLLSRHQKVSNAVSEKHASLVAKGSVPVAIVSRPDSPKKISGFWVVNNLVANRIWYKFRSHFVLPHNLVRGLVTAITSTPILPQNPHILRIGALNV